MNSLSKLALVLTFCTGMIACSGGKAVKGDYGVVPLPQEVTLTNGNPFVLSPSTKIFYPEGNDKMKKNAEFLASYIKEITGYELATATGQPGKGISLVIDQSIQNPEGYQLTVSDNGIRIAGSTDAFVEKMNAKAKELGATHTHFVNANGLHSTDHYTTAYDLYLIFNEALKLPLFCEIINAQSYTADYTDANGAAKQQVWKVGNWYLKGDREAPEGVTVLGGKTGTTQAAGYCLIMASDGDDGKEYISVVLKSANRPSLYDNMTEILTKISNK